MNRNESKVLVAALALTEYPQVDEVASKLKIRKRVMSLEDILRKLSKKPVLLKRPKIIYHNGRERYEKSDVSKAGWDAYAHLVDLVYQAEKDGLIEGSSNIVETLDDIIDES